MRKEIHFSLHFHRHRTQFLFPSFHFFIPWPKHSLPHPYPSLNPRPGHHHPLTQHTPSRVFRKVQSSTLHLYYESTILYSWIEPTPKTGKDQDISPLLLLLVLLLPILGKYATIFYFSLSRPLSDTSATKHHQPASQNPASLSIISNNREEKQSRATWTTHSCWTGFPNPVCLALQQPPGASFSNRSVV